MGGRQREGISSDRWVHSINYLLIYFFARCTAVFNSQRSYLLFIFYPNYYY